VRVGVGECVWRIYHELLYLIVGGGSVDTLLFGIWDVNTMLRS